MSFYDRGKYRILDWVVDKYVTVQNRNQVFHWLIVTVQSYKFIRQTRPVIKRPGYHYKGRWPGVLARWFGHRAG